MGRGEAELLRRYLADRDVACRGCGYNLRGLKSEECPECGSPISLRQLQEEESFRQWRETRMPADRITTLGLIGALTGMGWPVVFAIILGSGGVQAPARGMLGLGLAGAALVQLGLALLYLDRGNKMAVWHPSRKLVLALVAWCWGPGTLVVLAVAAAITNR